MVVRLKLSSRCDHRRLVSSLLLDTLDVLLFTLLRGRILLLTPEVRRVSDSAGTGWAGAGSGVSRSDSGGVASGS